MPLFNHPKMIRQFEEDEPNDHGEDKKKEVEKYEEDRAMGARPYHQVSVIYTNKHRVVYLFINILLKWCCMTIFI